MNGEYHNDLLWNNMCHVRVFVCSCYKFFVFWLHQIQIHVEFNLKLERAVAIEACKERRLPTKRDDSYTYRAVKSIYLMREILMSECACLSLCVCVCLYSNNGEHKRQHKIDDIRPYISHFPYCKAQNRPWTQTMAEHRIHSIGHSHVQQSKRFTKNRFLND